MIFSKIRRADFPILWCIGLLSSAGALATTDGLTSPATYTLPDAFRAAGIKSESLAAQREAAAQADEKVTQAWASILPTLGATASYTLQEDTGNAAVSNFSPATQSAARLTLTQPLFRGLREFAALRITQSQARGQTEGVAAALRQLRLETAQAFYSVLTLEEDAYHMRHQIELTQTRAEEIRGRARIGRSRQSELDAVLAALGASQAQLEATLGQARSARETLARLTGWPADVELQDNETVPLPLASIESYLARMEGRPDLRVESEKRIAAEDSIGVAWGAHLPSLDLTANYYLLRAGLLKDVRWDVQLALTVPIFAGGATQSKVREAASDLKRAELSLAALRRQAEQEVRTAHAALAADQRQIEALARAVKSAESSYDSLIKDYRLGLATNLEVLQALASVQDQRRSLGRATHSAKLDLIKLQTAAGRSEGETPAARKDSQS